MHWKNLKKNIVKIQFKYNKKIDVTNFYLTINIKYN